MKKLDYRGVPAKELDVLCKEMWNAALVASVRCKHAVLAGNKEKVDEYRHDLREIYPIVAAMSAEVLRRRTK